MTGQEALLLSGHHCPKHPSRFFCEALLKFTIIKQQKALNPLILQ